MPDPGVETPSGEQSSIVRRQRLFGLRRQFASLCTLGPRRIVALLSRAYGDWSSDGASRLGAALAYFTLFSVAPVLIVITGVAGLFIGRAAARGQVGPWLERFLSPEGAQAAELMLKQAATPTGGVIATVGGIVTLCLGASALVTQLRESLNIVWRVQEPSQDSGILASVRAMISDRFYAFLIVIGAGLLVFLSLFVNTAVTASATYLSDALPIPAVLLQVTNFVVGLALMAALFTLIYKFVPDAHVAWGDAWIGALVTALLFTVGTLVLSTFVVTAAGASVYGSAASVLALLLWVYYSAQVFFFGAEVTRIFANEYGAHIVPRHRSIRQFWQHRTG